MRILALIFVLGMIGCATPPNGSYANFTGNARRLMERPDAKQARDCSREWVKDALYTIDDLEERLRLEQVNEQNQ